MKRFINNSSQTPFMDAAWQSRVPDPATILEVAEETLPVALARQAQIAIRGWQVYSPTPLHALPGLASHLGVAALHCKDEGQRFGLGSFKALGGAYAVASVARERGTDITVACATEGNHGRSVAWGAQQAGVHCVIFLHEGVSAAREAAIARYGAQIRRVPGSYDDAVRTCTEVSHEQGWHIVSDTTWEGYEDIPRQVMAGYSLIAQEVYDVLTTPPSHVFVQAGVGGMAAAMMASVQRCWPSSAMRFVVVEPSSAACLQASALAEGRMVTVPGPFQTMSAGLACGEPSAAVLDLLTAGTQMFLALDDAWLAKAMRQYARPMAQDPAVVAGASGAAGLAGLLAVMSEPELKNASALNDQSRILLVNSENDTDPMAYQQVVGDQATDR